MKKFIIATFTCLLIAAGVLCYAVVINSNPLYKHVSPFEILDKEDMDTDTLYAYTYISTELVEPLQRYNDDSMDYDKKGQMFSRAYSPMEVKYDLVALKERTDEEKHFLIAAKDLDGNYTYSRLYLKLKFLQKSEEVYAENHLGAWVALGKHERFSSVLSSEWTKEHPREHYFSDKLLYPQRHPEHDKSEERVQDKLLLTSREN